MDRSLVSSCLIIKDKKFLLVNAMVGRPKGLWNNPGGRKEESESIEDCAVREAKEETGLDVRLRRLIGIFDFDNVRKYVFEAKVIGGRLRIRRGEISQAKWFSVEEIKMLGNITYGALHSAIDYSNDKFEQEYNSKRIV